MATCEPQVVSAYREGESISVTSAGPTVPRIKGRTVYCAASKLSKRYSSPRTASPIGEIAAACGYDDTLQFSKYFKRHTGLSPSLYRAEYKPFPPDPS